MVLTLSQVQAWSTEHLIEAATYWSKTADQWEDVFLQMRNQSHTLVWEGAGGDALRQRTGADLAIVSTKADELRQASKIARDGAGTIGIAQRRVLHAVEDAHNAGFTVGEDFSVTDIRTSRSSAEQAARQAQAQAQAQALATDIRQRAVEPLPPPAPGRLPPLTPGEMATPRLPAPPPQPPIRGGADLAPAEPPPVVRTPMEPPARLGGPIAGGPVPPESIPHPVQPPHSHHGPPVLGKDELPDLGEFNPG
ncbi:hypothetical protein YM3MPS_05900 [Mycobacterium pseudoshottsii]|uniref:Transmembrane protein n=2 Tax=Mycobacterium ulcerans group TaxID=2993898 RepID=A0A9N7QL10_9MYCO|nr:putative transmembrane protein [Mycobacterium sp. 012931]BDN80375.1 hypothetical protein NJB1907Z4_C05900 [Mycobacterium pseudoshottsii]BEH74787.1 hypothetical protein YM3MPS_05900 [Mycobacterium pseudoshottsii]